MNGHKPTASDHIRPSQHRLELVLGLLCGECSAQRSFSKLAKAYAYCRDWNGRAALHETYSSTLTTERATTGTGNEATASADSSAHHRDFTSIAVQRAKYQRPATVWPPYLCRESYLEQWSPHTLVQAE